MNSYEFSALRRTQRVPRLVIRGKVYGDLPGCPDLERIASDSPDVLTYVLIFREPIQVAARAFVFTETEAPDPLRAIRILLPGYQEFRLLNRDLAGPGHPVANQIYRKP